MAGRIDIVITYTSILFVLFSFHKHDCIFEDR